MANLAISPNQVRVQPPIGVPGDFASANPRYSALAGAGAFKAGTSGLYVGRFCWSSMERVDDLSAPAVLNPYGTGPVLGFVHRGMQALMTAWMDGYTMLIPAGGFVGDVAISGDFLAKNDGATQAVPGMKAYANFQDGKITFAATASPATGATSTASTVAAGTASNTAGSIADNVLTITGTMTGTFYPGQTISGTNVATGTKIVKQLTSTEAGGALGGKGTYAVSIGEQAVASTTISATHGLLTIGGTVAGTYHVGDVITGTGVTAGTVITALGTGTGGAGTYIVDNNTVVNSTAINIIAINVETKWYCRSFGLAGETVKISDTPLG